MADMRTPSAILAMNLADGALAMEVEEVKRNGGNLEELRRSLEAAVAAAELRWGGRPSHWAKIWREVLATL
jgi:hypothetical protein